MDHPEDVYCSTTEFKANLKHYKKLAETCIVHITEHGREGYVFTSIEVYEGRKAEAIHRAKWQVWAENACFQGTHESPEWLNLPPREDIEYLGQPWDSHVTSSFDDDVRRQRLSEEAFAIVHHCLQRLSVNPMAGAPVEMGPEAFLPEGTRAYRLPAGEFDIIYGIDKVGELQVYGLIEAL